MKRVSPKNIGRLGAYAASRVRPPRPIFSELGQARLQRLSDRQSRTPSLRSEGGQVMVETLLILPVFLTIVFTIMEMGYIAFWVIVLNHATFECARVGAMTAAGKTGSVSNPTGTMQGLLSQHIKGASLTSSLIPTLQDPQSGVQNEDLEVTATYNVPLVFPLSSLILSNVHGQNVRQIQAVVDMPVEIPLPYSNN